MATTIASWLAEFKHKMETRETRIGIIGMGYVGLPLALLFSGERFRVTGFDIDPKKVTTLNAGGSYIVHILPGAIQAAQKAGFRATADYSEIAQMDAVVICVPTPLNQHHEPDLSYVTGTVESIAPHIHEGQLIVLESTTYPGTTEEVVVPLLEAGNPTRRSQRGGRLRTGSRGTGLGDVRDDLPPGCARQQPLGGGDDQAG
jgi:UDP-N-acetyl-D-glucosamine dehydrogenase